MHPTFPEKNTFTWEEKPRWPVWLIVEMFRKHARTGTNFARRKAYEACIEALEQAEHEHGIETVGTPKLKQLLTAAAQEHGWYAIDRKKLKQPPDPFAPPGSKYCRKCREIKPQEDFMAPTPPAKAKVYGWKEDTTQKHLSHLCTPCRHKKAREKKGSARYKLAHKFSDLQLRITPGLATRVKKYKQLHAHIAAHSARVRAAFSGVKVEMYIPEKIVEYQFPTDAIRQFYESKRVYLNAARDRLEQKMGEAAPLPDTWGMLLTKQEQAELSDLHDAACLSSTAARKPVLWTLKLTAREEADGEVSDD